MGKIKWFLGVLLFPFLSLTPVQAENETYSQFHIVDINNPSSFEEIMARYSSYDTIDGDITEQLYFISEYEKDYQNHSLQLKDYPLKIIIKNSRGYEVSQNDIISVRVFVPPYIEQLSKEITINQSKEDIEEKLMSCFLVTNNYDLVLIYEWQGLEEIIDSGTYEIRLIVYDSFQNASSPKDIIVHIIETEHLHILEHSIHIKDKSLNEEEILNELLKSVPITEGYIAYEIKSNYFIDNKKPGTYQVTIKFIYPNDTLEIYQFKIINEISDASIQKINPLVYISLSVMALLSVLGVIVYIKRR